jgi:CheY-like chemotaxis protein
MHRKDRVIVLVEDSDDDADLTIRALRRNRVSNEIVRLVDGAEAITYLCHSGDSPRPPELILLDLKLPRVDGLDVLRALKADGSRVPVVVLTSSLEERDVDEAYRLGANSYVQKPIDFTHFADTVAGIGAYWLQLNRIPDQG